MAERQISASILPSSDANTEEDKKLRRWKAAGLQSLDAEDFTRTNQRVEAKCGLQGARDREPFFFCCVLQLEIRGPNESHLSVIDVPGIFKNTTFNRTTKHDITLVRNMVLRYMESQRSIMLAVVPANVDIATQEIIEMAREIDPEGERTLRILTKLDLVDKGAEHKVIQLIHDGNANGQLGWILVRNLGQNQLQAGDADRDAEERIFYQNAPWNSVPPENYGMSALMGRLQELLTSNVRRELPSASVTFCCCVCMQAADHFLVTGPEAPMNLFSPFWANRLSNERLEEIAGEGRASTRRRRHLEKEIGDLEAGKAVLLG
ncbi:hypothetical protein PENVUL_c016G00528 [Penicillium vulpinum]|uniref:GED domain-containing protein n=1 Tax=Penicillium vulpinum TaxID=29845 RepID=A0A1V6RZ76_9EURO|nr:hypothetical protein PENVUL_c016G00528 [Penicillium vulpinum]